MVHQKNFLELFSTSSCTYLYTTYWIKAYVYCIVFYLGAGMACTERAHGVEEGTEAGDDTACLPSNNTYSTWYE